MISLSKIQLHKVSPQNVHMHTRMQHLKCVQALHSPVPCSLPRACVTNVKRLLTKSFIAELQLCCDWLMSKHKPITAKLNFHQMLWVRNLLAVLDFNSNPITNSMKNPLSYGILESHSPHGLLILTSIFFDIIYIYPWKNWSGYLSFKFK